MPKFNTHPSRLTLQQLIEQSGFLPKSSVDHQRNRGYRAQAPHGVRNRLRPDASTRQPRMYQGMAQAAAKPKVALRRAPSILERLPISWLAAAVSKADALPAAQAIRACASAGFGSAVRMPLSSFRRWFHSDDAMRVLMVMLHRLQAHGLIDYKITQGAFFVTPKPD